MFLSRIRQLTNILHDIISECILHELQGVGRNLLDQLNLLIARGMIDASLENTTSVTVSSNGNTMLSNRVKDELSIFRSQLVKTLLDDVVSVKILDQFDNLALKSMNDSIDLLGA